MKKVIALAAMALGLQTLPAHATLITYNGFANTAGLSVAGNARTAVTADGTVMRLTSATTGQGGAAYSTTPVNLGANATFSTTFQFRLSNQGGIAPADGFTFILSNSATGLGGNGLNLGLPSTAKSVAIEFDTYNNGAGDGNSSNQVGIDVNGNVNSVYASSPYGVSNCGIYTYKYAGCMADGDLWSVTIGYDGSKLNATVTDPVKAVAYAAIQNYSIDIASILGTSQAYVGFTGSTGSGYENQDIVNWQFANTTQLATAMASAAVPEPTTLALLGLGLAGLGAVARRKRR